MSSASLIIRADANVAIGTGHVMRCLALAQAWQDVGGTAAFAATEIPSGIETRLSAESFEVLRLSSSAGIKEDASQTAALAQERRSVWIVVDGYQFGSDYQRALKAAGFKVLFLDDYGHAPHYCADIVLNQNLCADERKYSNRESHTQLLLGARYCLLRREFNAWREWQREFPSIASKILVTVGGSDPENMTLLIVQALRSAAVPDLEAVIVVGGGNPHLASVQRAVCDSGLKLRVVTNVANMPELMAWADLAVSGAGSTCWEMCWLGLPALLICVAPNQESSAQCLAEKGAALLLNHSSEVTTSAIVTAVEELAHARILREQIYRSSRELVDCHGASRVAAIMKN
jgi:UDP-2,4-diacetamido-2,4,6-trideoxy-beta-L-altropyranose hydrolase